MGSNPTSPTIRSRVAAGGRFASVNTNFESLNYHLHRGQVLWCKHEERAYCDMWLAANAL